MADVIIIGASGHGKVIADIVLSNGNTLLGFLDDGKAGQKCIGFPVLGKLEDYVNYPGAEFVIAIGNAALREKIAVSMKGVTWHTAVHPAAVVSKYDVTIGPGTVIMANAVVNPGASIGAHCIVNTAAVVEHDNTIEDFAHISVGVKLAGTVSVGKSTWVGVGAVVSNNVVICGGCMIGAGAVVVRDISESGTYVGVPARRLQ